MFLLSAMFLLRHYIVFSLHNNCVGCHYYALIETAQPHNSEACKLKFDQLICLCAASTLILLSDWLILDGRDSLLIA